MGGLIAHEWIAPTGGSENVLHAMANVYPDADIFCLWNDDWDRFPADRVMESWLAATPLRNRKALALPVMPLVWRGVNVADYDWTLVSSHAFAHQLGSKKSRLNANIFVYVHTPARYVWAAELDPRGSSPAARLMSPMLRTIDRARAAEGPAFAANSAFIQDRIRTSWHQDSTVIYPPVRVETLQATRSWRDSLSSSDEQIIESLPTPFIFAASRFVHYKRLDVAIAAGEAAGLPVVIAGSGPQHAELLAAASAASVPVYVLDRPSDSLLFALYELAALFVFAAVEDFGIMPVEAMCLGTPVLATSVGGAAESVTALRGGAVVESFAPEELRRGVDRALATSMSSAQSRAAEEFGEAAFDRRLTAWMNLPAQRDDSPNALIGNI